MKVRGPNGTLTASTVLMAAILAFVLTSLATATEAAMCGIFFKTNLALSNSSFGAASEW